MCFGILCYSVVYKIRIRHGIPAVVCLGPVTTFLPCHAMRVGGRPNFISKKKTGVMAMPNMLRLNRTNIHRDF